MEGNKDISLAGDDDVLGYQYTSMIFICGYAFSACESYDWFFDPSHIATCA